MKTYNIDLPSEFRSGNSIPVERATFTRERMQEVLEAYANARVREALEEAVAVAEKRSAVLPHYSDIVRGYADGRKAAASEIRALIPPTTTKGGDATCRNH